MRFGLVGVGEIGRIRARAVQAIDGMDLTAAVDSVGERAKALGVNAHPSAEKLCADSDVDAVIVSTPPSSHEAVTLTALRAGKHVLCEKPLAPEPGAARRMVAAASEAKRVLAVGFNQRHFPAVHFVKELIDDRKLGRIRHVVAYSGHRGLEEFHAAWESDPQVTGGGSLMDNGIHLIDHVRYLGGEFHEVVGLRSGVRGGDSEDNAALLLRADDGRWAQLRSSWTEWRGYRFAIEVFGDLGVAQAAYGPMYASATLSETIGGPTRTVRHRYPLTAVREKATGWQTTVRQTFECELTDFRDRAEGKNSPSAMGFDGFRAVEIAHAAYRSSERHDFVRLSDPF